MSGRIKLMVLMLMASICLAACSRDKEKPQQPAPPAEATKTQAVAKPPLPPPPPEVIQVTGKILEILDTGSFVYVLLDWNGQQVWAAVPGVDLKVGEVISLSNATMLEQGFRSTALNRTFEKMLMASGVEGKSPRGRATTRGANPNDPRNRRSGRLMSLPSPAPPSPSKRVVGQTGQ